MSIQKYSVNQHSISIVLSWIESGAIAIPEIQRPFVWSTTKVRDLIDSLYRGYPIGYLIAWRNPSIRLKDGTKSHGKMILIDGQQRVTALMAAILNQEIITNEYKKRKIIIAFNPLENRFEVNNPAIQKDSVWFPDISKLLKNDVNIFNLVKEYCKKNDVEESKIFDTLTNLKSILNNSIGLIELDSKLDIETVTEIFIRINSQGAVLSQADFAMSKIAANETYGGYELRKCIDYFCHLAVAPQFYQQIKELDKEFSSTEYFRKMDWLKNENDDLYDPSYTDMLRVSFTSEFKRGRLVDLVALLSGRNFETRDFEESIAEESYILLKAGIFKFMNENNFKKFTMIIRSTGFIESSMIRSQNVLNFAYIIYLYLRTNKMNSNKIEFLLRKWFIMSLLTRRYSASPESTFDFDIKKINEIGIEKHLNDIEEALLSNAFWEASLPQSLNSSVASSPFFNLFLASLVKSNDKGFLSKNITVSDLKNFKGDVHHLFPKNYLKKQGFTKGKYNQIANYVMMQSEINISIKDKPPFKYFKEVLEGVARNKPAYGAINDYDELKNNFKMHCIPDGMDMFDHTNYEEFLIERRKLIAIKIRDYYMSL